MQKTALAQIPEKNALGGRGKGIFQVERKPMKTETQKANTQGDPNPQKKTVPQAWKMG